MKPYLRFAEIHCGGVHLSQKPYLPYALPVFKNLLRTYTSPSFPLFVYIGRVGRVGRENAVVATVFDALPMPYLQSR